MNLKGGRISMDFLFNYCYCKIASLGPLKVRIRTKTKKDVIHDGTLIFMSFVFKQMISAGAIHFK